MMLQIDYIPTPLSRAPVLEAVDEDLFLQQKTGAQSKSWRKTRSADKLLSTVDLDGLPDNP